MAPMVVDPDKVRSFADKEAFHAWLADNHDRERELWIRIYKVKSGVASITWAEAVDVVLCWGCPRARASCGPIRPGRCAG